MLTIINVLTASLIVYSSLIEKGAFDLAALVSEAGIRCRRCGTGACAVLHGKWYRKQVTDLSSGTVYRQVPILRVIRAFLDVLTNGLNFFQDVYPLLLQAHTNGVEVLCLAGDRTGTETEEFFIDHTCFI